MATVTRSESASPRALSLADARSEFPDLRLIVRLPDGRERTITVPDPRAALAAALESIRTGTTCHNPCGPSEPAESAADRTEQVIIVPRPDDWEPQSPSDLLPGFESHRCADAASARALALSFNRAELMNPKGWWAIDASRLPAADDDRDDVSEQSRIETACACHGEGV